MTILNGTTTNATSTNFFAANAALGSLIANSGNITSLLATNATFTSVTSTNGFFSSLVGSTFAAGSATVGTSTIGFVNVTGSLFAPSGTITDLNGSGLVFSNATFTNATATTLFASLVSSSQIFVGGQSVCLANGTNCLADGSLQSAYNAGKSITLNSGHIELTSVTGTSSDFLTEDFGATATRMIGGGIAGVTTTGFDIIGYDTGNGRGVELTFSSDRDGVNAPAGQSYLYGASTARISYLTDKFDNPSLLLSTNTSTITVGNDYLYFSVVDNGTSAANMSMDIDGLFSLETQVGGGVDDVAPIRFSNGVDIER
ncbi:MAG: hypothetical protein H6759_05250 [Candidatus Nomurabacteria bacterium]|nr:MAG: hypothetical protein H6759_05250 [Candidatus Nomurabacteria bacterium]